MTEFLIKIFGVIRFHLETINKRKKVIYFGPKQYMGKLSRILVDNKSKIIIGKNIYFSERSCIGAHEGGIIEIGDNNYFSSNCNIASYKHIIIGDDNLFAQNVIILDHNHKYEESNTLIRKQGFECKETKVGSDCWICANVVICAGAEIGNHIVVAANSVVKGSLLEPGIYSGMPAKLVKKI